MSILLVFLILVFILFLPIPIKLNIHFSKNYFYIKFYNILLFSPEGGIINKFIEKLSLKNSSKDSSKANIKKEKLKRKTHNPLTKKLKNKKFSVIKLYRNLNTNKFKPILKVKGDIDFELEDAAITAITYGIACNISPLLYFAFSIIFKVKDLSLQIKPHFTGKNLFNLTTTSIFSFNIAQIIYILVLTIKSFENKKEVDP